MAPLCLLRGIQNSIKSAGNDLLQSSVDAAMKRTWGKIGDSRVKVALTMSRQPHRHPKLHLIAQDCQFIIMEWKPSHPMRVHMLIIPGHM